MKTFITYVSVSFALIVSTTISLLISDEFRGYIYILKSKLTFPLSINDFQVLQNLNICIKLILISITVLFVFLFFCYITSSFPNSLQKQRFAKIIMRSFTLISSFTLVVTYGNLKLLSDIDKEKIEKDAVYLTSYYQYADSYYVYLKQDDDAFLNRYAEFKTLGERFTASESNVPSVTSAVAEKSLEIADKKANQKLDPYRRSIYYHSHLSSFTINMGYALGFLLSLIGIFYTWLNIEYRHFNNKYVELMSSYKAIEFTNIDEEHNKKITKELSFLLNEEYLMFFKLNLAYGKFQFSYMFKPYFYILNICYAFGFDDHLDNWTGAFKVLADQKKLSNQKLSNQEKKIFGQLRKLNDSNKEFITFVDSFNV